MKSFNKTISLLLVGGLLSSFMPIKVFAENIPPSEKTGNKEQKREPKILKEIVEKREGNTKYFLMDDMSYEAVMYPEPVHYLENGQWKDIDNSQVDADIDSDADLDAQDDKSAVNSSNKGKFGIGKEKAEKGAFENKNNEFKVKIAKNAKASKLVSIKKGDYEISWKLNDANNVKASKVEKDTKAINTSIEKTVDEEIAKDDNLKSATAKEKKEIRNTKIENEKKKILTNISSKVKFEGVYEDVNLDYLIKGNKVKENIVINEKLENPEFKFNLKVKNLIPKLDENNVITFYDEKDNNKAVYTINAPYMYDANLEHSNNIKVSLNQTKEGYELVLIPDKEWLNSATVQYPVTIDPSVDTSQDVKNVRDTFVSSAYPNNNYQQAQLLEVGYGSATKRTWTYMKFDDLPKLSSSDMIIGVDLWAVLKKAPSSETQVNVHRVTGSWDSSTITWNNAPDIDNTVEDYQTLDSSSKDWIKWDITNIAKEWYNSGNNGLVLKTENEYAGYTEFLSSDIDNDYKEYRPVASFHYVSNSGLENYWTYHSTSAGRTGTAYVNDYNGNLVYVHEDLSMNGNLMPVQINHVYNSNEPKTWDQKRGWMGAGWTLNIYQRIENDTNSKKLIYIDGDGTKHYFSYTDINNVSNVSDELNLGYTISRESPDAYTLKDKNYNTIKFYFSDGSLNYFADKNGNKLTAQYTQASNGAWTITGMVDGAGRITQLRYTNGVLEKIIDPAGRITSFGYESPRYEQLKTITYPDGNYTDFGYDSNNNLSTVTNNADGTRNQFWYTDKAPYRVNWIRNTTKDDIRSEDLSINYGNNRTDFTDVQGRTETYLFDDRGKTTVIKDSNDNAQYYRYSDKTNETKIGTQSKTQKTIVNYLLDHNAEYNNGWTSNNSGAAGYTTEEKYIGQQALKISSAVDNQSYYNGQYVSLARGKTYTFSSYVKTKNIAAAQNGGAGFEIQYMDSNQKWQTAPGKINLTGTKEWDRYEFTFTIPNDAYSPANNLVNAWAAVEINNAKGTAYFDGMQIEEGNIANRYNLVENGDFRSWDSSTWNALYWNKESGNEGKDIDYVDYDTNKQNHPKTLDVDVPVNPLVYKLQGKSGNKKGIYQTLNISGKAGDSYVFGGWAKAESVPLTENSGRLFELSVGFEKADGTIDWVESSFNEDTSEWQYLSDAAVAKNDYKKIWVDACYYKNANTAYFDGIQLYKDEFGSSYTYDSKGNIISTESLAKQNSKFEYSDNDLVKHTDPKGSQFNYIYSTEGKHNLLSATSAENVVYSFEYDAKGNPKKSKVGDSTLFINSSANYKPSGNYIESTTDSSGNTVKYNYDETDGTLDTVTDPKGAITSYVYNTDDTLKDVKKTVDNKEIVNSYTYDKDKIKTITHNGFNYTFGYDSLGNNTTVSVGNQNLITNTYGTYYSAADSRNYQTGLLKESKYGNGQIVKNDYDNSDRLISRSFNNQQFKYSYDADGNLGYHEDLVNQVNYRYSYDLSNRLTKVSDNKGNALNYSFDINNNLSAVKDTINSGGTKTYSTYYTYDKDNKPLSIMFSKGSDGNNLDASLLAHYTFDNGDATDSSGHGNNGIIHGKPTFVDSSKGKALKLSASPDSQWVEFNDFDVPDTFSVSLWLKPDSTADGQSFIGKHTYDGNNIFVMGYWDNGYEVNIGDAYYSSKGTGSKTTDYQHLVAVVKKVDDTKSKVTVYKNNKELWSQDINGVIGSTKGRGWALGQDWDGSSVTDLFKGEIDEVAIYNRDLTATEVGYLYSSKSTINNTYSPEIGRLKQRSINSGANSFVTKYNYMNGINGAGSTTTKISSIDNNGKGIAYTYDPNGNIESITENNKKIAYTYNEANELTREDNQVLNKTIAYDYDAGGNFKTKIEYPYTPDKTIPLPAPTNTVSYTYGDANWKDKLTNFNGKAITYDAIGNPLTYDGYTYSWEWGRRLASMTGNGKTISYKYNDSGIRTQKTVNNITTSYHLVGDKVTYEDNGTDKIYYTYDSSDNLVSINLNGVEYFYIRNAQNDIIGLFDKDGTQVASYSYDSWGKLISIKDGSGVDITNDTGSVGYKNPYRYRGYRYDTETGLYYLQSRYYNPEWGRFINSDAAIGSVGELLSHNLFAYCINNPVNMLDGDGNWPSWLDSITNAISSLVTTITSAISSVVTTVTTAAEAASSFVYSKMKDLGKGWSYRRDKGGSHTREKEHVHVQGGGKKYQQDVDGGRRTLENPPGLPHPPAKVRQRLKEKEGWDWDENAAKPTASKAIAIVGIGGGAYFAYRAARMIPSLAPPLWWTIPGNLAMP
ncbi:DNRLRE domain-containing protein [Clostridium beijerinckii]|uniref:DNRLRE domain-containing protein n=1 Tax=Clostridium beijerinckii TaxID=1520 RepID=UPI0022DF212D|nr:DNRLRE domain-containing protein [Clostridium beijerinckii]